MRADMGGAAVTVSTIYLAALNKTKGQIVTLTPLAENLPSGSANKPGDVVVARNGLTIQVDNTDAEGRLLLADTLCYACDTIKPDVLIDSATLTGKYHFILGQKRTQVGWESKIEILILDMSLRKQKF